MQGFIKVKDHLLTAWFCFLQLAAAAESAGFIATAFAVCTSGVIAGWIKAGDI